MVSGREVADTPASWKLAGIVLAGLLSIDAAFIGLHLWLAPSGTNNLWNVELDGGHAEKFQHLKWLSACLLLLVLALKRRAAVYIVWSALFFYFLVDDATMLHEGFGIRLSETSPVYWIDRVYVAWFPGMFLRPQDFGEMTVALIAAVTAAVALALCWPARADSRERTMSKWIILWIGLFAVFAVGVDIVHIMALDPVIGHFSPTGQALGLIEDGGEMICASLLIGGLTLELARTSPVL